MTDEALTANSSTRSAITATRRLRRHARGVRQMLSLLLPTVALVLVAACAVAPTLFTSQDPLFGDSSLALLSPSLGHPFGTDQLGRDVFARFIHGTRTSLQATSIAVAIAAGGGMLLGLVAGFIGGTLDAAISRVLEVLNAIPGLLLSLTLIAALGFGVGRIGLAVGIAGIPHFARVMRAEVLRVRTSLAVEAARMLGARTPAVLIEHVVPHTLGAVIALAVLEMGSAVLAVSALSFLGFGAPPPAPEWGALVADGRNYLATSWWMSILPGLAVAFIVVCANRLARGIREEVGSP